MVQLFRYPAAQVKSDTGGLLTRPAIVPGEALLKDPGKVLFPDADAGICDDQGFAIPIDADSSSGRGVFQRVGEELLHHKGEPLAVCENDAVRLPKIQSDVL